VVTGFAEGRQGGPFWVVTRSEFPQLAEKRLVRFAARVAAKQTL